MPHRSPLLSTAEIGCVAAFLCWLATLPLPFGSIVPAARVPLVVTPIAICAVAALLRAARAREGEVATTRAYRLWTGGALVLIGIAALQLVPLAPVLLRAVSPESHAIWSAAGRVATLADVRVASAHPISVDPESTLVELFRLIALFATFQTSALIVRDHRRRTVLAFVLAATALFELFYGVREAALGRYAIWGWVNTLIFNRVTGTFVNPNHFAHYAAIVLPMAVFILAATWREIGPKTMPVRRRFILLIEQRLVRLVFAVVVTVGCVVAVLLAQSRGALLSLFAGTLIVGAMITGRRPLKLALGAAGGLVLVAVLIVLLGSERTVARFKPLPSEQATLVGRRIGIETALGVWQRFPLFGSGAGTFPSVALLEQKEDVTKLYHRAHNDYAEIAATMGGTGFVVGVASLLGGYVALARMTFGPRAAELRWRRKAFQCAALGSLTIAMVHALGDFNFFIPASPATLAAIAGAAVAVYDSDDKRTRR